MSRTSTISSSLIPKVKGTVLLVDDDRATVMTVKKQIVSCNYDVFSAVSGDEALEIIRNEHIDILITDICMPGVSGIELLKHSQEFRPDIECVFITAFGEMDTAIEAMKLGAFNYLLKPVRTKELSLVLEYGMERIRLNRMIEDKQIELERSNKLLQQRISEHKQAYEMFLRKSTVRQRFEVQRNSTEEVPQRAPQIPSDKELIDTIAGKVHTSTQSAIENVRFVQGAIDKAIALLKTYGELLPKLKTDPSTTDLIEKAKRMSQHLDLEYLEQKIPWAVEQSINQINQISSIALTVVQRDLGRAVEAVDEPSSRQAVPRS